jgi:hypothetical protein
MPPDTFVIEAEDKLRTTVSRPICLDVGHPFGTGIQTLILLYLTITSFLIHVRRPVWREDGSNVRDDKQD